MTTIDKRTRYRRRADGVVVTARRAIGGELHVMSADTVLDRVETIVNLSPTANTIPLPLGTCFWEVTVLASVLEPGLEFPDNRPAVLGPRVTQESPTIPDAYSAVVAADLLSIALEGRASQVRLKYSVNNASRISRAPLSSSIVPEGSWVVRVGEKLIYDSVAGWRSGTQEAELLALKSADGSQAIYTNAAFLAAFEAL